MILHDWFIKAAELLCLSGAFWFVAGLARKAMITNSVTITRETDQGEHIALNANFLLIDSVESRQKQLEALFAFGDARRKFCHDRFMAIVGEKEAKPRAVK